VAAFGVKQTLATHHPSGWFRPGADTSPSFGPAQSSIENENCCRLVGYWVNGYFDNASASGAKLTNGIDPVVNRLFNNHGVAIT
jgi:hypothetical protein